MSNIEVREYRHTYDHKEFTHFFLIVDDNSRLMITPWNDGTTTFEWDGTLENFDLRRAISEDIPKMVGLVSKPRLIEGHEDDRGIGRVDVDFEDGKHWGISRMRPGTNNPLADLYDNDKINANYQGREMNLLIDNSFINTGVVDWVKDHHFDPGGIDIEAVTPLIRKVLQF
jgi:hypothetical protein